MAFTSVTEIYVDPSRQTRTACTITNSTTTATVTLNSHGYSNSDTVKIQGATETEYNGNFVISNVTTNTFDYTMASDPGGSATGSPLASKLNLSGVDGLSDANAYPDLQYALDTHTRVTGNTINRFNIKAGTAEILTKTLDVSTFGNNGYSGPNTYHGYTSTAGDGGIATISGDNGSFAFYGVTSSGANYYTNWRDLRIIDFGSYLFGQRSYYAHLYNCELSGSLGVSYSGGPLENQMIKCYVHSMTATSAVEKISAVSCFIKHDVNGGNAIYAHGIESVLNNFISAGNNVVGISTAFNPAVRIFGNSILGSSGNVGIRSNKDLNGTIGNNLIEGFTNAFYLYGYNICAHLLGNSYFNCTNQRLDSLGHQYDDTEQLAESPFAKTGSLPTDFTSATFWDGVYAYFSPVNIGSVVAGGNGNQTRGATDNGLSDGLGAGSLHPLAYN